MANRIIGTTATYDSATGLNRLSFKLREGMAENDRKILFGFFKTPSVKDLFKWTNEDVAAYRSTLRVGAVSDEARLIAIDTLLKTTPCDTVVNLLDMSMRSWQSFPADQRRILGLIMPPQYCICCDTYESVIMLLHADDGLKAFGHPYLQEQLDIQNDDGIADFSTEMDCCPNCKMDAWEINRFTYNAYSENRKGLCTCDGCRQ